MSTKCTPTLITIYKILILSIVLIPVISAFSLPTSLQEFLANENIVQGDPHGYLQNIRFKRQNEEEIEGSGSTPEYDILPDSEYDIVESSGEEEIIEEISPNGDEFVEETEDTTEEDEESNDNVESTIEDSAIEDILKLGGDFSSNTETPPPVLEKPILSSTTPTTTSTTTTTTTTPPPPACETSTFGCCGVNSSIPAHGNGEIGCCMLNMESQKHGCCPDFITLASGPNYEGCNCSETEYGCCPDGKTAARGEDFLGCGCAHSSTGCCDDQVTVAPPEGKENCPCHTTEFGCCPDGQTTRGQAQNLQGCSDCSTSEHGCCPDQKTPALGENGEGCGCAGSEFGCCPDGESMATGKDFEGCEEYPGKSCSLPVDKGTCQHNLTYMWFFDVKFGGCSQFLFCGGENDGNSNRYEDRKSCATHCIKPPGSGNCYLPKVEGATDPTNWFHNEECENSSVRYYFDRDEQKCKEFNYTGCLGNANNFQNLEECQQSCGPIADDVDICLQRYDAGPCRGSFERWFYDKQDGVCKNMTYSGCQGNSNRFVTKEECDNVCKHEAKLVFTKTKCILPKVSGYGKELQAKWYFNFMKKTCQPFYYFGQAGNENRFDTWDECEAACPNAFAPEIEIENDELIAEEGLEILLDINTKGNPTPEISWQKDDQIVTLDDRISQLENGSLLIANAAQDDSGIWTVQAENGLGVETKQIILNVYPSRVPIEVTVGEEEVTLKQNEDLKLTCDVEGYPIPEVKWYINNTPLKKDNRIQIYDNHTLFLEQAKLIDEGIYTCRAKNEHEEKKVDVNVKIEESEEVKVCIDEPGNNCPLIVQIKYCTKDPGFAVICCKSCTESGQLDGYVPPPPEVAKPDVEEDTSEMEDDVQEEVVVEEEESSDEGSGIDEPELSEVEGSG